MMGLNVHFVLNDVLNVRSGVVEVFAKSFNRITARGGQQEYRRNCPNRFLNPLWVFSHGRHPICRFILA